MVDHIHHLVHIARLKSIESVINAVETRRWEANRLHALARLDSLPRVIALDVVPGTPDGDGVQERE